MASLRIVGDDGSERLVELRERNMQIGRGRDNDIVLPDPQKGVSRTHAELRYENGRYVIVDLQSQNGTWVNGQRVERAEVPPETEIVVGVYRLILLEDSTPAAASTVRFPDSIDEIALRTSDSARLRSAQVPSRASRGWLTGGIVGAAFVILVAVAWMLVTASRRTPATAASKSAEPAASSEPLATRNADLPPAATPLDSGGPGLPRPGAGDLPGSSKSATRRTAAERPPADWATTGVDAGAASSQARVARKPGESLDAWRTRGAALQTRYAYSKRALDRGDFAAAAGGFEALLIEEPGFLDAPQLLVQANAGLRVSARDLYEAGNRLDAVGDWIGALQKYDQARLIHSGVPGLAQAIRRVQDKLRVAGTKAFNQARQYEASGRTAEAMKEYEKAFQWLPADDANREIARTRVDQLKRRD